MKVCYKQEKITKETSEFVESDFGDEALSQSAAFGWYFCLQATMTRVALVITIAPLNVRVLAQWCAVAGCGFKRSHVASHQKHQSCKYYH